MGDRDPISIAKSIPKFDSTTNVDIFSQRVDNALAAYELSSGWAILNFHLLIDGEVSNWWKWAQIPIIAGLTVDNMDARWTTLKANLRSFYDPSSIKKEASQKMKAVKFVNCASAGDYVSQKLALIAIMDPGMSVEKQIEKLIKGLPDYLQNVMWGSQPATVEVFLNRLRKMESDKKHSKGDERRNSRFPKNRERSQQPSTSGGSSNRRNQEKRGFDSNGKRVCFRCGNAGHFIANCPVKEAESSVNVIQVEELHNSKN